MEAALSVCSYVDQIMIHADPFHNYCVALIVAAQSELKNWASKQGITYSDFSDLCQKQGTVKEVLQSLVKVCVLHASQLIHSSSPHPPIKKIFLQFNA